MGTGADQRQAHRPAFISEREWVDREGSLVEPARVALPESYLAMLGPEGSPLGDAIVRALVSVDARPVGWTESGGPAVAVLDIGAPGASELLRRLSELPFAMRPGVILVSESADYDATPWPYLDVVAPVRLGAELPSRVRRAFTRVAQAKENAERQREQQSLLELTARYAAATDVEALLHDMTLGLTKDMDIDRAALVVVDEAHEVGFIVAASDDAALKDLKIDLNRYPEVREVVRTNKPVVVENAATHPMFEDVKSQVVARGISALAAFPLTVQGRPNGALLLRRTHSAHTFSPREISFLATVANATAVALKNVRQIEAVRQKTEREMSARLVAEAAAARLKRYESYFQHLSDGVAILDESARVISLNAAGLKLLDVSLGEAVGRHINALANPGDQGVLLDMLTAVGRGQRQSEVDIHARTLSGRKLTLSVSGAPLQEEGATAIVTMRDVTRARELAAELTKTKEFLERLIDSSVDAIIAADMKGRIILFNKAAEVICGYSAADARKSINVRNLYPEGQAREVMSRLRSRDYGGVGRVRAQRQDILNKAGERVPVSMTASIIYEGNAEVATVGIFTDLRDRLMLERKLSDAETRLEESEKNAVIVALAGTAAHELNQPLTSVMGYAELLRRRIKEEDPNFRPVDIIFREAERMAEIVRKIGKITRYETTTYVGNQQIVDLNKAVVPDE